MVHSHIRASFRGFNIASRRWQLIFSGLALLLLLGTLCFELKHTESLVAMGETFLFQLHNSNWLFLTGALMLMPLNWLVETLKWRQFVQRYNPISLGKSLMAVWVGVGFSLFTPNRVGEYGGRILFIHPEHRWKAVFINLIGNYSQYLALLTIGCFGGIFYLFRLELLNTFWLWSLSACAALSLVLVYLIYFNIRRIRPWLSRVSKRPWWQAFMQEGEVLQHFNTSELAQLLSWAILRYGIYSTQYFLLLIFFGINPGFLVAYAGIALIFLVQTCLPLAPLTGLFARGNMAVWVWMPFGEYALQALASSFSLWIINLILPALIGTFSLFHVNITKQTGYEDD